MTKEEARKRIIEIIDETNDEEEKIINKAIKEGYWKPGLDSNRELFEETSKKAKARIKAIQAEIDD